MFIVIILFSLWDSLNFWALVGKIIIFIIIWFDIWDHLVTSHSYIDLFLLFLVNSRLENQNTLKEFLDSRYSWVPATYSWCMRIFMCKEHSELWRWFAGRTVLCQGDHPNASVLWRGWGCNGCRVPPPQLITPWSHYWWRISALLNSRLKLALRERSVITNYESSIL